MHCEHGIILLLPMVFDIVVISFWDAITESKIGTEMTLAWIAGSDFDFTRVVQ